jgi:hypothetical protein
MVIRLSRFVDAAPSAGRRVAWIVLVAVVVAVHIGVTNRIAERMGEISTDDAMPPRIEVTYVRELALSTPPPTAVAAAPIAAVDTAPRRVVKKRRAPKPPPQPASAPEIKIEPEPALAAPTASAPEPKASEPSAETASASPPSDASSAPVVAAAASPSASASGAPAFEWPNSTRVSYVLTGYYRGDVNGSAQVEWLRSGSHYQVHLDLVVGPSMAPVITRQMTSDGEITAGGLVPHRYDQSTKVMMANPNRVTIGFEPDTVTLANGDRRPSVPGVQDTASQFVQLTYVFSTRPELLRVGGSVDIPLALPHKVDVWTYDVVAEETLNTPVGQLTGIHLKPRRRERQSNSLSAEMWFAPQLRYLPARIRIEQDAQNYVDLLISKLPETQ